MCTEKLSTLPEVTQPVAAELAAKPRFAAGGWAGEEEEVAGAPAGEPPGLGGAATRGGGAVPGLHRAARRGGFPFLPPSLPFQEASQTGAGRSP